MSSSSSSSSSAIPYALMPIAAALGLYAAFSLTRTVLALYLSSNSRGSSSSRPRTTARERLAQQQQQQQTSNNTTSHLTRLGAVLNVQSYEFGFLLLSVVLSLIAYAFMVARVQVAMDKAVYYSFDPYQILGLERTTTTQDVGVGIDAELLQATFKAKIQQYRSSTRKTAAADADLLLDQCKLAYQALAEGRGKIAYERFGHPSGPFEGPAFLLTIPRWLLVPTGPTAWMVYLVYLAALASVCYVAVQYHAAMQQEAAAVAQQQAAQAASAETKAAVLLDDSNSVSTHDLSFIMNHLTPTSQYMDILTTICATPDNMTWSARELEQIATIRAERIQQDKAEKNQAAHNAKKKTDADLDLDALVNQGGWDDDDDDDNDNDKKGGTDSSKTTLTKDESDDAPTHTTTGKLKQLLEGLDEGVLGREWVERTLQQAAAWPPPNLQILQNDTYEYNGQTMTDPLDHPGLRRMLCMTMGRLNSQMLNSHPELLQAGTKKLIDQTYFRSSMEFRQRVGLRLEATLRLGMTMRSFRLVETTIESVAHFKVGCVKSEETKRIFQAMMKRQYDCLPELKVHSISVAAVGGYDDIATQDKLVLEVEAERMHAEKFMRQKINQCQKQGIPPQVALQNFREGWWMLMRHQRLDGPTPPVPIVKDQPFFTTMEPPVQPAQIALFEQEEPEYKLLVASPALVSNIAQKTGKFQLQIMAPTVPGKYRFILTIKSQDFLGCDQECRVDIDVLDAANVQRPPATTAATAAATAAEVPTTNDQVPEEPKKEK